MAWRSLPGTELKTGRFEGRAATRAALFVSALVALFLLAPFPAFAGRLFGPALFEEIENLAHPLAFAVLAFLWLARMQAGEATSGRRMLLVVALLAAFGGLVELLQVPSGRDASWRDAIANAVGATVGGLWFLHRRQPKGAFVTGIIGLSLLVSAPLAWTVLAYGYRSLAMPVIWHADSVLLRRFSAIHSSGSYPGLSIFEPFPDWRGHRSLDVLVLNPHARPVRLMLSVQDGKHRHHRDDRYDEEFTVAPSGESTIRVPLERIQQGPLGRQLELGDVRTVLVFQRAELGEPLLRVVGISLVR